MIIKYIKEFNTKYEYKDRDFILDIKYNFKPEMLPLMTKTMTEVRKDLENAYKNSILKTEADTNWIENFLLETYLK